MMTEPVAAQERQILSASRWRLTSANLDIGLWLDENPDATAETRETLSGIRRDIVSAIGRICVLLRESPGIGQARDLTPDWQECPGPETAATTRRELPAAETVAE